MSRQSRRPSRSRQKNSRVERVDHVRWTRGSRWLVPLAIALVTVFAFLPVMSADFVAWVTERRDVLSLFFSACVERQTGDFSVRARLLFWKSIAPFNLAPFYERPSTLPTLSPTFLASYATVLGSIGVAWLARHRSTAVTAALAAFTAAVFPLIRCHSERAADRS